MAANHRSIDSNSVEVMWPNGWRVRPRIDRSELEPQAEVRVFCYYLKDTMRRCPAHGGGGGGGYFLLWTI